MRYNQLKGLANVSSERLKNSQHQLEKITSIYNKHIQQKEEEKNFYLNNCRKTSSIEWIKKQILIFECSFT